jgi:hypothetical protein
MEDENDMLYNDDDFDLAVSDIMEHVTALNDPELMITIDEWVTKLTSKERGYIEICYLRMLRRMVVHRQICWPFVDLPPMGPLLPLSPFLNTPGSMCNEMTRSDRCLIKNLQRETCTRASQTVDEYEENEKEYEDENDSSIIDLTNLDIENGGVVIKITVMDNGVDLKHVGDDGGKEDNDDKNSGVTYKNDDDKIGKDGEYEEAENNKMGHNIENEKGGRNDDDEVRR